MRLTAVRLLQAGFATFRLNFRDHGDTHHLNPGLFHSNRIDEVVRAPHAVAQRNPARPQVAPGY
jgi:predicted alpha/beta-fold hydrolase